MGIESPTESKGCVGNAKMFHFSVLALFMDSVLVARSWCKGPVLGSEDLVFRLDWKRLHASRLPHASCFLVDGPRIQPWGTFGFGNVRGGCCI